MNPHYEDAHRRLYRADCRDVLATMDAESVDACVTDPPYELAFMGKAWDASGVAYDPVVWRAVLRVLKPGAHLLAFGGTRTHHRMVCAIEDAGFEIRDEIQWLYGSGFPKSLDVSKAIDKAAGVEGQLGARKPNVHSRGEHRLHEGWRRPYMDKPDAADREGREYLPATEAARKWEGWGTALKPAAEPICVARKPIRGTVAANVLEHGTGALNIGGCRIATDEIGKPRETARREDRENWRIAGGSNGDGATSPAGRWPANVILGHHEECGWCQCGHPREVHATLHDDWCMTGVEDGAMRTRRACGCEGYRNGGCHPDCAVRLLDEQSGTLTSGKLMPHHTDNGKDRGRYGAMAGLSGRESFGDSGFASRFFYCAKPDRSERHVGNQVENTHPTVKPVDLIRYLVRLVTPPGGIVLDPFGGSGTTAIACHEEGFRAVLIEKDPDHFRLMEERVKHATAQANLFSAA